LAAAPKESFNALVAWHSGLPEGTRTLLSAHQVERFCRGEALHAEALTRGRRGAFLVQFDAELDETGREWHLVVDAPYSQVQAFELARRLEAGAGSPLEIARARADNTAGVDELLARADGFQRSGDPMAAAHHRANVLFNIMRGGVFVDGTQLEREPNPYPTLHIARRPPSIFDYAYEDFEVHDYRHHAAIKAPVAV